MSNNITNQPDAKVTSPIKPFPYYPPVISEEEKKRMEVMMDLNKWANNLVQLEK